MLLLIRARHPRVAGVLGFVTGVASLALGIACGAPLTLLILGGGSSIALSLLRYLGKRHGKFGNGGGLAALR